MSLEIKILVFLGYPPFSMYYLIVNWKLGRHNRKMTIVGVIFLYSHRPVPFRDDEARLHRRVRDR